MAESTILTTDAIAVEQFKNMAFREYVDKLVLRPYMGTSPESVIHVDEDTARDAGDAITFNLVSSLNGAGIEDDSTMEGNEEQLDFYSHRVELKEVKNAIRLGGPMSRRRTKFDQKMEARAALTTWLAQKVENDAFEALSSISGVAYGDSTDPTQRDAWAAANVDRILYGAAVANDQSGDHSASLLQIDSSNDTLKTSQISLAKRLAQLASPKIRPIRIENGEEYFVMFVHPYCARDLKNEDAWQNAQRNGMPRGGNNPIFTGMIGMWDGVIIKESPKVLLLDGVGGSSIDVAMNSLCGAQALVMGHGGYDDGSKIEMVEELFDYGKKPGYQISTIYGIEKAIFNNSKQHGVVSVFSAAVAD